ncbi:MAG: hypothetical protein JO102_03770 [Elusimicrobia bacterium]|nr:hypothetical protein [Elusimicrobiota bacterium]
MRNRIVPKASASAVGKVAVGFLAAGALLFLRVLLPVQAERGFLEQRKLQAEISRKRAELDELNARYAALTALPQLDQWAKTHGPWVAPTGANVVAIEN